MCVAQKGIPGEVRVDSECYLENGMACQQAAVQTNQGRLVRERPRKRWVDWGVQPKEVALLERALVAQEQSQRRMSRIGEPCSVGQLRSRAALRQAPFGNVGTAKGSHARRL